MRVESSFSSVSSAFSPPKSLIPQLDGAISPASTSSSAYPTPTAFQYLENLSYPSQELLSTKQPSYSSSSVVHQAQFILNENKQINKLKSDSLIEDFSIEISPSQENINIQCNSGFYTMLLRPCLDIFKPGIEIPHRSLNITIQCRDITKKTDKAGNIVNNVIFLRMYNAADGDSLGSITIHLHHTARKLQLQGSAKMPNKTSIPVWFLEHILKDQLERLAATHSCDISSINTEIQQLINSNYEACKTLYCGKCDRLMKGKSTPVTCHPCSTTFHKKCFPGHECPNKENTQLSNTADGDHLDDVLQDPQNNLSFQAPSGSSSLLHETTSSHLPAVRYSAEDA